MTASTLKDLRTLGAAIVLCETAGGLGTLVTRGALRSWYPTLRKPAFTPPGWVFGPVWTLLYALMGGALFLTWRRRHDAPAPAALRLFTLQLLLNALWSVVFFGLKAPRAAFVEIVALWGAIVLTVRAVARVSGLGALLLLPYLLWVSFAAVLNLAIWRRNA